MGSRQEPQTPQPESYELQMPTQLSFSECSTVIVNCTNDLRQPKPSTMDVLGKFSRGQIAWNMGDYENTDQRNSRGATLVRQAKETLPVAFRPPKLPMPPKKEEV
ncbi:Hypothetical protein D623_10031354 [Myotis brandtii]|uniref:Uncharacterized protein n=1 Tax=Myotis brandtii TaxID=109478 RepID=S7MID3_MYOBR|nr:Hypothetical protein D623_10031354 [Myotis brandtii]